MVRIGKTTVKTVGMVTNGNTTNDSGTPAGPRGNDDMKVPASVRGSRIGGQQKDCLPEKKEEISETSVAQPANPPHLLHLRERRGFLRHDRRGSRRRGVHEVILVRFPVCEESL